MIANLISENAVVVSGSGPQSSSSHHAANAKERIKAFTLEFDEAAKIQSSCSVPDVDLGALLRAKVKELIFNHYIYFYNQ